MQLEQGSIVEGKVTGILKFGAFVDLGNGKSGMVHISEVAGTYVNDINDFLKVGQQVKVKVISIGEDGKIALSIKKAEPKPEVKDRNKDGRDFKKSSDSKQGDKPFSPKDKDKDAPSFQRRSAPPKKPVKKEYADPSELAYAYEPRSTTTDAGFEDMLSKFKASSEDRMSVLKKTMDVKKRGNRRK